jgi:tetratricopeptide (TPR) repeat protein
MVASNPKADAAKAEGNELVKLAGAKSPGAKGVRELYNQATGKYSEAIKLTPKDPKLFSNRALSRFKAGAYAGAVSDAESTIKLAPTWNKGYFRLGEVLATTGHFERAAAVYACGNLPPPPLCSPPTTSTHARNFISSF